MKTKSLILSMLSMLALSAGFTSCSDDDNSNTGNEKIAWTETRAFILNEGSMNANNADITYFDWATDVTYAKDLFLKQNKHQLGDTGQDIIADHEGNIYVIVSGSNYITKLNEEGVEQATVQISEELGSPRYGVLDEDYLYVTCYGGYIAKINTNNMTVVGEVAVGQNPEYIIKKDGCLYCTNSGWGADNRVAKVEIPAFEEASFVEVMNNPDHIISVAGHIYVQGYGADSSYPWGELLSNGTFETIGQASSWAAFGNTLYLAYSATDWNTYATTTTFSSYDVATGTLSESSPLKDAPAELATASVYSMSVNPYTGDLYIATSDFINNGVIYHFDKEGTFIRKFASTGINPRKIIFLGGIGDK